MSTGIVKGIAPTTVWFALATGALIASSCEGAADNGTVRASAKALTVVPEAQSQQEVARAFPTAQAYTRGGRIARLYGPSLATGSSSEAAAEAFRIRAASALGAEVDDVRSMTNDAARSLTDSARPIGLMYDRATGEYKFHLYRYAQARGGVRVHQAELFAMIKNTPGYPVVWASSSLRDLGDFKPDLGSMRATPTIDQPRALSAIAAYAKVAAGKRISDVFSRFSTSEPVIFAGAGDEQVAPRLAVQFIAENDRPPAGVRFIADAQTGEILNGDVLVHTIGAWGSVRGKAAVGTRAWDATGDPDCSTSALVPFPYASVSTPGLSTVMTDSAGLFYNPGPVTPPVTLMSPMAGQPFTVVDASGGPLDDLSLTATPPNPANFVHNQSDSQEFIRAQANGYVHANRIRDFVLSYLPSFPGIATGPFTIRVNVDDSSCPQGWGGPAGVDFCKRVGANKNAAFGHAIYHEFGHTMQNLAGGSMYGTLTEGLSDAIATSVDESPGMAYGWGPLPCSTPARWMQNNCQVGCINCPYNPIIDPDPTEYHICSQAMSGIIWDIRQQLKITHASEYRDILNPLLFNVLTTIGGSDSINTNLAIDFLHLDDDDGDISNGTPHSREICAGFEAHGVTCPPMPNSNPCATFCASPTVIPWTGGSYNSPPLGTGTICLETTHPVMGGNCGNLAAGRTLSVNGIVKTCNGQNWSSVPGPVNGGYCFTTTAGNYPWAFLTLW